MVSLKINKQRFLKELDVNESEDLLHQIVMLGVEVEDVTENEIEVDITPNRPDMLSQPGLTRAVKAFINKAPGIKPYQTTKSKLKVYVDESVKNVRPYTACAVAKNLKLDEEKLREIIDIQEKLHVTFCRRRKKAAIGVYPMEAIKGNITFKALPKQKIKFRPLESSKQMTAVQILSEHPKGIEYAHLLEGLDSYPLFVDKKNNILSMPPVINSHTTGKVELSTKEIFIESSGFDFRTCHEIIQIMCAALADMGATIQTVDVHYGKKIHTTPDMRPTRQEFYGYYVNRRLGTKIKKTELPELLGRMGLGFEDGRIRETHYAIIPPYRVDFLHPIDVVEDLAISFGYENIKPELPEVDTVAGESDMTVFQSKIREILVGHGLIEAKNLHLTSKQFQDSLQLGELVTLKNSVSEGYDSLRKELHPSLLQTLSRNRIHEYPQQLFELGRVFRPTERRVIENEHLGIVLAGEFDFTRIKQLVDSLLLAFDIKAEYQEGNHPLYLEGRCAQLFLNDLPVGHLGELNPGVISSSELSVPVASCELELSLLLKSALSE